MLSTFYYIKNVTVFLTFLILLLYRNRLYEIKYIKNLKTENKIIRKVIVEILKKWNKLYYSFSYSM